MLNCYRDLIGFTRKGCGNSVPPFSGYYLEDFEYFNVSRLAEIADLETSETAQQLFENKLNLAFANIRTELVNQLSESGFRLNRIMHTSQIGNFSDSLIATPSPVFRGLVIERRCEFSRMAQVYIPRVRILCHDDYPNASLIIKDGAFEQQVPVNLEANIEQEVGVYYFAKTKKVSLTINNANVRMNQSTFGSTACCGGFSYEDHHLRLTGVDGGNSSGYSWGIVPDVQMVCNMDVLLCEMRNMLSEALMYKLQEELILEAQGSDRLNSTTLNQDQLTIQINKVRKRFVEAVRSAIEQSQYLLKQFDKHCIHCIGNTLIERAL